MCTNVKKRKLKRAKALRNKLKSSQKSPLKVLLHRISQTINHFVPDMEERLDSMPDYRGKRSEYRMAEIVMAAVFMFLLKEGSRNQINEDRQETQFRSNYKLIFGLKLPHLDTVSDVMNKLDPELLESCRRYIIK